MNKFYVSMTDRMMSGWGEAENKTNIFQVECSTEAETKKIVSAASKRNEMSNILVNQSIIESDENILVTNKKFDELGKIWTS